MNPMDALDRTSREYLMPSVSANEGDGWVIDLYCPRMLIVHPYDFLFISTGWAIRKSRLPKGTKVLFKEVLEGRNLVAQTRVRDSGKREVEVRVDNHGIEPVVLHRGAHIATILLEV